MIVKYSGPRRGGITQIGSTPVQVPWGTPVEIDDQLGQAMLDQYPDEWEVVDTDTSRSTRSPKAVEATPEVEEAQS